MLTPAGFFWRLCGVSELKICFPLRGTFEVRMCCIFWFIIRLKPHVGT